MLHLLQQGAQVHHHAVADHGCHPVPQNSAGDQLEDEFLRADIDGVSGVVATLITRHNIEALREKIDDLALALVAPLCAENDYIFD